MKAVVYHGPHDIRVDDVDDPTIQDRGDAIVRLTASAICGTDLHFVRDTMAGTKEGTILGHEGVGVVEEVGADVRNLSPGDRVVICSTIACGHCSCCRAGYFAQCDQANPNAKAGTLSIVGVYPPDMDSSPIGAAFNKNLTATAPPPLRAHARGAGANWRGGPRPRRSPTSSDHRCGERLSCVRPAPAEMVEGGAGAAREVPA